MTTGGSGSARMAIDGGTPSCTKPFPPWPHYDNEQIEVVSDVLRSGKANYWIGQEGREFEKEFAAACGCEYGVANANGTLALELALHAVGIEAGDEVVVPCRTFIATASGVIMRGATPVLADIDPDSQNITADSIAAVLTEKTKAIIVVHLAGWPCEMDEIMQLARKHNLRVIEDCAQAHGATYKGRSVGSIGDAGAFSFCQDKIITTGGEGGMLVTNDKEIWNRAWSFKDHGKSWDAVYNREHSGVFRWVHESFGTNWRLTEMQSALGRVALRHLPDWVATRRANAAALSDGLADVYGLRLTSTPEYSQHSHYRFYCFLEQEKLAEGWDLDRIIRAIQAEGVPCGCGSGACPELYREVAFQNSDYALEDRLPNAKRVGESSLMFFVQPTLNESHMQSACRAARKVLRAATAADWSSMAKAA